MCLDYLGGLLDMTPILNILRRDPVLGARREACCTWTRWADLAESMAAVA